MFNGVLGQVQVTVNNGKAGNIMQPISGKQHSAADALVTGAQPTTGKPWGYVGVRGVPGQDPFYDDCDEHIAMKAPEW